MEVEFEMSGFLSSILGDKEGKRLYLYEEVIEPFLNRIDEEMKNRRISRHELAEKMGCDVSDINRMMDRSIDIYVQTMVNMVFHVGLKVVLSLEEDTNE